MISVNQTSTDETNPVTPLIASLSRRTAALVIDGLILGFSAALAGTLIPFFGGVIVWFFYGPLLESSEIKATIGKHLMGIQVTDLMGRRISLKAALIRNGMKVVSISILFIGFLIAIFTSKKQSLHDLLAETIVIYGRSEKPIGDAWLDSIKEIFGIGKKKFELFTSTSTNTDSIVSQLERLESLYAKGALTDQEYLAAKNQILKI